ARVPGVRAAGFVNVLPLSTYNRGTRYVVEGTAPEPGREPSSDYRVVTDGYFEALGIPIAAGRRFDSRDRERGDRAAIVNRTLARRAFGDGSALGRRVRLGRATSGAPWLTIVGVVGDVRHADLTGLPQAEVYVPLAQSSTEMMMLAARTAGNPDDLIDAVQRAITSIDPLQPVYHVKSMRRLVDEALLSQTSVTSMMAIFAVLALVLAAIGIYGVISSVVRHQSR